MSFSLSGEIRGVHVAQVINNARQYRSNDKTVLLGTEHSEFIGQVDEEGAECVAASQIRETGFLGVRLHFRSYSLPATALVLVGEGTLPE